MATLRDATQASNLVSRRAVRARVIEVEKRAPTLARGGGDLDEASKSKQLSEDPFSYLMENGQIIAPPFDLLSLAMLDEQNSELGPCVEAMEVNIEGFGHRLVPRFTETAPENVRREAQKEKVRLENFFAYASLKDSYTQLRRKIRKDLEKTGNAYKELLRNARGEIQGFEHVPSYQVRLGLLEQDPVEVEIPILELQTDGSFRIERIRTWQRFRKFVQSTATQMGNLTYVGGYKLRWFKEYGDPRTYDNETGEIVPPEKLRDFPAGRMANELVHFRHYSTRSPYGLPRFIGNLLSIFGDRASEEVNYSTLKNNNIPSMMLLVSNGQLTEASINRIKDFVASQIQGADNYSKFLLLEAEGEEEGEDGGQVKIDVKPLTDTQHKDSLFQHYSKNNQDKIRRAFRLPPILVGRCHSSDTEYLTRSGWKTFDQIEEGLEVGTYDPDKGELVFEVPSARHVFDHDGTLCHINNRGFDALVTPNHTLWLRPSVSKTRAEKNWRKVFAQDVVTVRGANNRRIEMIVSGGWKGEEVEDFWIPPNTRINARCPDTPSKNKARDAERAARADKAKRVTMDTFLQFLGYFIADGSTLRDTRGQVLLSKRVDNRTHKNMVDCLFALGLDFNRTDSATRQGEANLRISHCGLWDWLRENCGTEANEKQIPLQFLNLPPRQLKILLNAMVECDGHRPTRGSDGSFTYSTISKILNDQLHEICFKLGYVMTSRCDRREGWQDLFTSYAHLGEVHTFDRDNDISCVPYVGKVSCFTVPSGFLITKRNGRVLVSGNSDDYTRSTADTARKLADEQVFAPERAEYDTWLNRRIFPEMGITHWKYKSNSPNTTDNTELVKILGGAEKTGGMTPRIARMMLEDILGQELPEFPADFENKVDLPFSLLMAEAVKNKADPAEPGQQVTALKSVALIEKLTSGEISETDEAELASYVMTAQKHFEKRWREQIDAGFGAPE
jgi:PBSX family phage portal protein